MLYWWLHRAAFDTDWRSSELIVMHRSMCDLRFALAAALLRLTRCLHFSTGYTTGWVNYAKWVRSSGPSRMFYLFIYLFNRAYNRQRTRRSLTCHRAKSQCLTQKEPVIYINKLIKKTTDTKLRRILADNQKNLLLVNTTMNDTRGQERKGGV